jgi:hypothetical protein
MVVPLFGYSSSRTRPESLKISVSEENASCLPSRVRHFFMANEFDARLRAFPAQPVFGPAFTPGCSQCHDAFCQPRLRGSCLFGRNGQEPRKRG